MRPWLKDTSIRVGPGYETTEAGSFGTIDVSSNVTIGGLKGSDAWRGVTEIASGNSTVVVSHVNMAANSGYPILTDLGITTVATHGLLISFVNTIVDGVSFTIDVNSPVGETQQMMWMALG